MLTAAQVTAARERARGFLERAGIVLTPEEASSIEVADFGLGELERTGLQLVTYVNTARVCAKELVLFPRQTCPEHRHPPVDGEPGKEETFRCRWGRVYLYVAGQGGVREAAACEPPAGRERTYTVWNEVVLEPGGQYTIPPDTLHWFQAGHEGAVVSEFSTRSRDERDVFTDAAIVRAPQALPNDA
jgi:D-lyxose ketol-isomerase